MSSLEEEKLQGIDKAVKHMMNPERCEGCSILDEDGMFRDDDKVNNPTHYQSIDAEVDVDAITCMRAAFGKVDVKSFCLCNAMKYIFRSSSKGQNTDINKAVWYLNKFLELGGYE